MPKRHLTRLSHRLKQIHASQPGTVVRGLNRYMLVIIFAVLGLYLYIYPDVVQKIWTGLRAYSGESAGMITFESLFQATLFFLCASYLVRAGRSFLDGRVLPRLTDDVGVRHTILTLISYIAWILLGLMTLSVLGVNLKNLAIVFGALSVGIGFGLQNIVNNFVSGIIILFERPIKEGDWVVINGQEGLVKHIRIRATELETFGLSTVIIPNADILSGQVKNLTHENLNGRIEIIICLPYDTDAAKARQVLLDITRADRRLIQDPAPYVVLTDFTDTGIRLELRAYTGNVLNRLTVKSDLMLRILDAFRAEHISFSYPQRVVRLSHDEIK